MGAAEELRDSLAKPEKPPKRSVWDIGEDIEALADRIAEAGGEITPDIEAMMDALDGEWDGKVERTYLYLLDCELDAEKAASWKAHHAEVEDYYTRKARGLRNLLLAVMARTGRDKIQTSRVAFRRKQSPVSYRWTGNTYDDIPAPFKRSRAVVTLDTDAVKRAVAEGVAIPQEIVGERGWHLAKLTRKTLANEMGEE